MMKKKIAAVALAAGVALGFSATASAGYPNQGKAPNGANHASVASTLGGEAVSGLMPCHVTSAAPQCD
jgi:hypothetical protein